MKILDVFENKKNINKNKTKSRKKKINQLLIQSLK